jgi:hypothetical protein
MSTTFENGKNDFKKNKINKHKRIELLLDDFPHTHGAMIARGGHQLKSR